MKAGFARSFIPTFFASDYHPWIPGAPYNRQLLGLSAPSTGKAGGASPLTKSIQSIPCCLQQGHSFAEGRPAEHRLPPDCSILFLPVFFGVYIVRDFDRKRQGKRAKSGCCGARAVRDGRKQAVFTRKDLYTEKGTWHRPGREISHALPTDVVL
jgi:hypothetical protein